MRSAIRGALDLVVHLALQAGDALGVENAFAQQPHLHLGDGVARVLGLDLFLAAVLTFVVAERVRVGTDDVAVNQRGAMSGACVGDCLGHRRIAGERVRAIDFGEVEVGEVRDQLGDVSAGSVDLDRGGDGVLVVLDDVDYREFGVAGGVERLPEFALAGGAFADRDVDDFVAVELDVFVVAIVVPSAFGLRTGGVGMAREVAAGLGAPHRVEALGRGRGTWGDDVQLAARPVGRHLAATAGGIVGCAHRLQQLILHGVAQGEADGSVAIVGEEPVVARAQGHSGGDQESFVSGAGDLEEDFLLPLEHDLAVVGAP